MDSFIFYKREASILNYSLPSTTLTARILSRDKGQHFRAFISQKCSLYRFTQSTLANRVLLTSKTGTIVAHLIVLEDDCLEESEIGLSNNAYEALGFSETGGKVKVEFAEQPPSFKYLRDRVYGEALEEKEILSIVQDIAKGRYSDEELAAFMISCTSLTLKGTVSLTRSMVGGFNNEEQRPY